LPGKLPKLDKPVVQQDLVLFQVDYFNVLSSQILSETIVSSICRPEQCDKQVPDYFLDRERNRLITAEAMTEARKLADAGNLDQAKQLLTNTVKTLKASTSAEDVQIKEYIHDLEEAHTDMVNRETYKAAGAKKMAWKGQKMEKQRACGGTTAMETTEKMKMKQAYMQRKLDAMDHSASTSVSHPQPTTVIDPAKRKSLMIGNTHTLIPDDIAEESKVTPGQKLTHDWTLYVRGSDLSFIDKVEFTIHHSYTPNTIVVTNEPFEISRKGWGFFNCRVLIHHKAGFGTTTEFYHTLNFEGNGNFQEVVVNLQ